MFLKTALMSSFAFIILVYFELCNLNEIIGKTIGDNIGFKKLQNNAQNIPFGEIGVQKPIDEIEGFMNPKDFYKEYVKAQRPLLMKNAAKSIPAFRLWSDDYLMTKTPDDKTGKVLVEIGKKENRKGPGKWISFKTFLQHYNASDIYMVNETPYYLKPDVLLPWSIQCEFYQMLLRNTIIWFSSGGTKSVIHTDDYENINCLYRGQKRLVFIDPHKYKHLLDKIIDIEETSYSSINVESIDLKQYPFLQDIELQVGMMEAGDCIYIPFDWIHQVESFGSNLAVNIWWMKNKYGDISTCNEEFNKTMSLDKVQFYDELLLPSDEL